MVIPIVGLIETATGRVTARLSRRVFAISVVGLVLYTGGYVAGLLGDHFLPGAGEPFAWGPATPYAMVIMLLGVLGSLALLPLEAIAAVQIIRGTQRSEQHGGQISSEGAPSAPPNESSP